MFYLSLVPLNGLQLNSAQRVRGAKRKNGHKRENVQHKGEDTGSIICALHLI
jgi:hypothetical protein